MVQARAREYCTGTGARLMPFGGDMPKAINAIAATARAIGIEPDEISVHLVWATDLASSVDGLAVGTVADKLCKKKAGHTSWRTG